MWRYQLIYQGKAKSFRNFDQAKLVAEDWGRKQAEESRIDPNSLRWTMIDGPGWVFGPPYADLQQWPTLFRSPEPLSPHEFFEILSHRIGQKAALVILRGLRNSPRDTRLQAIECFCEATGDVLQLLAQEDFPEVTADLEREVAFWEEGQP